jgi:hypothetical protein
MGLGGGTYSNDGKTPAPNPREAARCPWSGIRASYTVARDPWKLAANRQLRVDYHRALIEFLMLQPSKWPVTSAFLWNTGSWDPQAFYGSDSFVDHEITEMIKVYNQTGHPRRR